MDHSLLFLIIEGAYIFIAVALGWTLRKRGRPYRVFLPVAHVVFAALIVTGVVTELVVGWPSYALGAQIALATSAVSLAGVVAVGIAMLVRRRRSAALARIHGAAVIAFSAAIATAQILSFAKV